MHCRSDAVKGIALGGLEDTKELEGLDVRAFSAAPRKAMLSCLQYVKWGPRPPPHFPCSRSLSSQAESLPCAFTHVRRHQSYCAQTCSKPGTLRQSLMADHSQMQSISARSGTLFDVAALKVLWMGSLQAAFRGAAPKFWEADSAVEWPSRQPPAQLRAFWRAAEPLLQ